MSSFTRKPEFELAPSGVLHWTCDNALLNQEDYDVLRKETISLVVCLRRGSSIHPLTVGVTKITTVDELQATVKAGAIRLLAILDEIDRFKSTPLEITLLPNGTNTAAIKNPSAGDDNDGVNWPALVLEEEALRLSPEIQAAYRLQETDESPVDWIEYTGTVVQPMILKRHGLAVTPENLFNLRKAAQLTDVFWVKYNRAKQGELRRGSSVPAEIMLYDAILGRKVQLLEMTTNKHTHQHTQQALPAAVCSRPLVVLAGSVS